MTVTTDSSTEMRLREQLRLCQQAGEAALRAATAQIMLLQKELSTRINNSNNSNSDANLNADLTGSGGGGSAMGCNSSPNATKIAADDDYEVVELRKQVRHLDLDLQYHQRLAANAAAERSRLEREVLNLQGEVGDLREQLEYLLYYIDLKLIYFFFQL